MIEYENLKLANEKLFNKYKESFNDFRTQSFNTPH